ncbi:MAG TPA: minor capsid protein [Methanocorpusculum sp.]|nr:minor capsid protein [Methanocorpusculum sp.]
MNFIRDWGRRGLWNRWQGGSNRSSESKNDDPVMHNTGEKKDDKKIEVTVKSENQDLNTSQGMKLSPFLRRVTPPAAQDPIDVAKTVLKGTAEDSAIETGTKSAEILYTIELPSKENPNFQTAVEDTISDYHDDLMRGGSFIYDEEEGRVWDPWLLNKEDEIREEVAKTIVENRFDLDKSINELQEITGETQEWAETAARTESQKIANEVHIKMYNECGFHYVQVIAAKGSERTCKQCLAEHGKVYKMENAPQLPFHPNCRCVLVPYVPAADEIIVNTDDEKRRS